MAMGKLGARGGFGHAGAVLGRPTGSVPASPPSLDFSKASNSQYIGMI